MKDLLNILKGNSHAIRILSKGYLPISLLSPSKLAKNTTRGKASFVEN